jgi:hypothetical protein
VGFFEEVSRESYKYFFTFVDDFSKYLWGKLNALHRFTTCTPILAQIGVHSNNYWSEAFLTPI